MILILILLKDSFTFDSSLLLVAIHAHFVSVHLPVFVLTLRRKGGAPISVVAMVAHPFSVELSVSMWALVYDPLRLFFAVVKRFGDLLILILIRIYSLRRGFN